MHTLQYKLLLGKEQFTSVDISVPVEVVAVHLRSPGAHYQRYVDEASKKELKDILIQCDQTLLVADFRHCERKKLGRKGRAGAGGWWLCSLPEILQISLSGFTFVTNSGCGEKIKEEASSDSGGNLLSSPAKASIEYWPPLCEYKKANVPNGTLSSGCYSLTWAHSSLSQMPLNSAQPAQLHPAASLTRQTLTTWLAAEGLLTGTF